MSVDLPFHTPLTPDQQTAAGLTTTWPLAMADKVRFGELDRLNHVNNAVYMTWFESIRIQYFHDWDISRYRDHDPKVVIRRAEVDYLAEMKMGEVYVVTARCTGYRTTSMTIESELWSGGTRRATMACVIVLLSPDGTGRFPIPTAVQERFHTIDGVPLAVS